MLTTSQSDFYQQVSSKPNQLLDVCFALLWPNGSTPVLGNDSWLPLTCMGGNKARQLMQQHMIVAFISQDFVRYCFPFNAFKVICIRPISAYNSGYDNHFENIHLTWKGGGGGYGFFLFLFFWWEKHFLSLTCAEQRYILKALYAF